jgi:cytochrome c oxidase subunit IV
MEDKADIKNNYRNNEAGVRLYFLVWGILISFTAITVAVANLNLGKLAAVVCLAIAAVKSTLVLLYFMHLRYEKSTVIRILIPIVIVLLVIFIGLTYSDVISR